MLHTGAFGEKLEIFLNFPGNIFSDGGSCFCWPRRLHEALVQYLLDTGFMASARDAIAPAIARRQLNSCNRKAWCYTRWATTPYKWSYGAPRNGRRYMGNWGYIPYKWSYFTVLITGSGAHLVWTIACLPRNLGFLVFPVLVGCKVDDVCLQTLQTPSIWEL